MNRCTHGVVGAAIVALLGSGCATNTETGLAAGGLLGAGAGALIGSQTGNADVGAVTGAALGAATGGLVGAGMDKVDRDNQVRLAAATAPPAQAPVSVNDIVQMSQSGVDDGVIISSIRASGVVYQLTPTQIVELHNCGVRDRVIQAMIDSAKQPAMVRQNNAVIVEESPVYIVDPRPRVSFGFGYGPYCRHRHGWGWRTYW